VRFRSVTCLERDADNIGAGGQRRRRVVAERDEPASQREIERGNATGSLIRSSVPNPASEERK